MIGVATVHRFAEDLTKLFIEALSVNDTELDPSFTS